MAFGILLFIVYFIPTIAVWGKEHDSQVIALNIFTGWTGIGWVISLIWALKNTK